MACLHWGPGGIAFSSITCGWSREKKTELPGQSPPHSCQRSKTAYVQAGVKHLDIFETESEMLKRRQFLKAVGASTAAALVSRHPLMAEIAGDEDVALHFASDSMELQLLASA